MYADGPQPLRYGPRNGSPESGNCGKVSWGARYFGPVDLKLAMAAPHFPNLFWVESGSTQAKRVSDDQFGYPWMSTSDEQHFQ